MKGLLLKDLYLTWKYYKIYFFLAIFFVVISFWTDNNVFMLSYPLMFIGVIPMGLQNIDENGKWDVYCGTMPVTKRQIVSEKYLIGLLFTPPVALLILLAKGLGMAITGTFQWSVLGMVLLMSWLQGFLVSALSLPLIFRFGAEKGRIVQYVVIGSACGLATVIGLRTGTQLPAFSGSAGTMAVLIALPVLLYILSWRLSIRFYEKREIR